MLAPCASSVATTRSRRRRVEDCRAQSRTEHRFVLPGLRAPQRLHEAVAEHPSPVLFRDRWTCQQCGAPASHVDHIRPVLFGGTDDESNLQALCAGCNLTKATAR